MQILVTQIGARRHYAVPAALERAGILAGLCTDVSMAAPWLRTLRRIISPDLRIPGWKSLQGRTHKEVPDTKVTCVWGTPWSMWKQRRYSKQLGQYAHWVVQNESFGREVVRRGFGQADAVYAFNGAAVEIFEAAKARGLKCILDMTIAPLEVVERLLTEERQRFPGVETHQRTVNSPAELIARERQEWKLADLILCGSEYVADTLAEVGVERSKCRVVRWGYSGPAEAKSTAPKDGRLRILIAGTVELRKGIPYILEAARLLNAPQFQFRFVGPNRLNMQTVKEQFLDSIHECQVEFAGPVPRSEMSGEYRDADVLLHASLAEGSANVCYEAMAHGLPVIATPNAGSTVQDGITGSIIPIRDSAAIIRTLRQYLETPETRHAMGETARRMAQGQTLLEYQKQLARTIQDVFPDCDSTLPDTHDIQAE